MTDQPQEAERSADGRSQPDRRNLAAKRKADHREAVLEKLRNAGLAQQVIETATKLADETVEIDSLMVQRLKAANEARLALLKKYLPDVKAVEVQDEDGNVRQALGYLIVPAKS